MSNCQVCQKEIRIESEDTAFYEKIGVPSPTFCPECRQVRRMSFRNERNLYRRKCDVTGKDIISIFSPESPHKVCESAYWYSDKLDPMEYGRDYDFSKPFFEQFRDFSREVPLLSVRVEDSENCEYNNDLGGSKDCYLCARTHNCRNVLYTYRGNKSSDCVDCMQVVKGSDRLYECVECIGCHGSRHLYFCEACSNSAFLWNSRNCLDCFMSANLRNKQYVFRNEQLTKEEYAKRMNEINLGSQKVIDGFLAEFESVKREALRKYATILNSPESVGDNLINCNNCYLCFAAKFTDNGRYLWNVMYYKDSMDIYSGGRNSELGYECTATSASSNVKFCLRVTESRGVEYSYFCRSSGDLFGCIGLDHKNFCIFNKQYSEDEYRTLVSKIKEQMREMPYVDRQGREYRYGEFFPQEISPFAYNETVAQEWFTLTKSEAEGRGFRWRDPDRKEYEVTMSPEEISDNIDGVEDSILKEVIGCKHAAGCSHGCTTAFKIIPQELHFYRSMNIPLPRLCPNCRHFRRVGQWNPMKLWHRKCMCAGTGSLPSENTGFVYKNVAQHQHGDTPCPHEFESSYAPDRPEIVYCEKCYQAEVA